ncbi:MAG TPA: TadE/TadG family type IV pilus assembly protein [Herpetosiphonaceae bacterium]|nr:TadE/TadG family type IV pilus assembly protein [Herpetosiphonaceae bacterium]
MWRARGPRLRDERGVNLVEFALVAPVFFLIIFGILDFGRVTYQYNLIASSAREGARMAIIQSKTDTQVRDRVVASSAGLLTAGNVTIIRSTCPPFPCGTATISVTHAFTPVTPLISNIIGESLTLRASSTMVVER